MFKKLSDLRSDLWCVFAHYFDFALRGRMIIELQSFVFTSFIGFFFVVFGVDKYVVSFAEGKLKDIFVVGCCLLAEK